MTTSKGGRPKAKIDLKQVEALAQIMCTNQEIAHALGVSRQLVDLRISKDKRFKEALERGRALGRASLRRRQFKLAESDGAPGQAAMLIWLGKNLLGQTDKVEQNIELHDHSKVAEEVEQLLSEISARDSGDRAVDTAVEGDSPA